MKLNPDCVRDLLLCVEDVTGPYTKFVYNVHNMTHDRLKNYSHEEILYHVNQCSMSELIIGVKTYDAGEFIHIADLSPKGHEFIANIRSNTNWEKTKSTALKVGSNSLSTIVQIAAAVIAQALNHQLGIS